VDARPARRPCPCSQRGLTAKTANPFPLEEGCRRWGQRVTSDISNRRCGPLFPAYWDLFVRSIEAAKVEGKPGF
jgi:hypothetical protein